MTLSATPSACALGGGASAKASGGRAKHTHPSQPQKPLQPGSGHDHGPFSAACARARTYLCGPFPPLSEGGLASTEHAVSAVGFETLARASLTRSYPCLYWAVPRASRGSHAGQHRQVPLGAGREPRIGLGAELQDRVNLPHRDVAGWQSASARHGSSAASQMPIKGIFSPLFMCRLRPAVAGSYYYVRPARASRVPCNDAARGSLVRGQHRAFSQQRPAITARCLPAASMSGSPRHR